MLAYGASGAGPGLSHTSRLAASFHLTCAALLLCCALVSRGRMVFLQASQVRAPLVLGFLAAAIWSQNVDAQKPDVRSASFIVSGCQKFLSNKSDSLLQQGRCFGIIETLLVMGQIKGVAPEFTFCPAPEVATGQLIRVAVDYIERRPQRMHEDFLLLALEAFHEAWPCN